MVYIESIVITDIVKNENDNIFIETVKLLKERLDAKYGQHKTDKYEVKIIPNTKKFLTTIKCTMSRSD